MVIVVASTAELDSFVPPVNFVVLRQRFVVQTVVCTMVCESGMEVMALEPPTAAASKTLVTPKFGISRRKRKGLQTVEHGTSRKEGVVSTMQNSFDGTVQPASRRPQIFETSENNGRHIPRQHVQNVYSPFPVGGSAVQAVQRGATSDNGVSAAIVSVLLQNQAAPSRESPARPLPSQRHSHHSQHHLHRCPQHQRQRSSNPSPIPQTVFSDGPADSGSDGSASSPPARLDVPVDLSAGTSPSLLLRPQAPRSGISRSQSSIVAEAILDLPASLSGGSSSTVITVFGQHHRRPHQLGERECRSTPCSPTERPGSTRPSTSYLYLYARLPQVSSNVDLERLGRTLYGLEEGRLYYTDLDSTAARALLQDSPEGTFLVRDSSDPKYLFSLSVKTARGATSVRVEYFRGYFQLDCEDAMKRKLPRFETLLDLLDFHSAVSRDSAGGQYRWLESSRRKDMVMRLTTPRRHSPPSLCHLARVAVNQNLEDLHLPSRSTDLLPLPVKIKQYLREYPYKL